MTGGKWRTLLKEQGIVYCPYCLKPIETKADATIDHVLPKSRFEETKTVVCCRHCNSEKGALTAKEYREWKILSEKEHMELHDMTRLIALNKIRTGKAGLENHRPSGGEIICLL